MTGRYGPKSPRPDLPVGTLGTDFLETRSDQPYLVGRALAVVLELDRLCTQDGEISDRSFDRWQRYSTKPRDLVAWIAKDSARMASTARRRHPDAVRMLEEDLAAVLARADVDTLPARWTDETAGTMTWGYQAQSGWYAYNGLVAARQTLAAATSAAKAAAVRLVSTGMSEAEAARTVGLDRMTVRKALGK